MTNASVILHPLCLLSVVDHYNRVAKDTSKRVVGVLLGSRGRQGAEIDVANSFGVPFEERPNDSDVWFLDHNYLETMFRMFKKVNSKEDIVGFYSTGPLLKKNDLKIRQLMRKFTGAHEPVFIIIDVRPGVEGLPTTAYEAVEEIEGNGKEIGWAFKHIPCIIQAEESEAVGVEHLVRDINDPSTSTLALKIKEKISGLSGLATRLTQIKEYIEKVVSGKYPINNQIVYNLQNILNLLPNLNVDVLVRSMQVKTNDMHMVMYISSLIRSVVALHSLLLNKIKYKDIDDVGLDGKTDVTKVTSGDKDADKEETKMEPKESPSKKSA